MTNGRQRVKARNKALAKWIKGKKIKLVKEGMNNIKIFKIGFNMGWKAKRKRGNN